VLHDCLYERLDFQWQPENLWRLQVRLWSRYYALRSTPQSWSVVDHALRLACYLLSWLLTPVAWRALVMRVITAPTYSVHPSFPWHQCCVRCLRTQATLEAQWDEATLKAARLMNALEYLAETPVRQRDVAALLRDRVRSASGHANVSTPRALHSATAIVTCPSGAPPFLSGATNDVAATAASLARWRRLCCCLLSSGRKMAPRWLPLSWSDW
jgi:hypothetical protein